MAIIAGPPALVIIVKFGPAGLDCIAKASAQLKRSIIADRGGKISQLSPSTIQNLNNSLPSYCSTVNPIDILEEATPKRFSDVLDICLKDENSDGFLIIYAPQEAANPIDVANIIIEKSRQTDKPILASFMSEDNQSRNAHKLMLTNGIPVFKTPEQAVSTMEGSRIR